MPCWKLLYPRPPTCWRPSCGAANRVTTRMQPGQSAWVCYTSFAMEISANDDAAVWGPYPNYDDVARFEYGRRFWKTPRMRARLLAHWLDERHPGNERFSENRAPIEALLASTKSPAKLDAELRQAGTSLRCVVREIPPVFGSFFSL